MIFLPLSSASHQTISVYKLASLKQLFLELFRPNDKEIEENSIQTFTLFQTHYSFFELNAGAIALQHEIVTTIVTSVYI